MKRILISGVAIAACFGLATTASAQYGTNYKYSSYGYSNQEVQETPQQAVSPSDVPVPVPATPTTPEAGSVPAALSGGSYDSGGCATGACGSGCSGGPGCGCGIGAGNLVNGSDRNIVFGLRALWFERSYEDDRGLGSNVLGNYWFTTDADHEFFGGIEATIGVRNCSGSGWEMAYWGLFPSDVDVTFATPPLFSAWGGLADVDVGGVTALDAFNAASNWRLYRRTEIHNFEVNLLRNGGQTCGILGGAANIEWLAGLRWFKFSEDMRFAANGAAAPFSTLFDLDVENNMIGFQLGARIERCINNCWTLSLGTKFGVYNNDIYARQSMRDINGVYATIPSAGVDYVFGSRKDDVATLGELDLGLNYQFNACTRANFGYRAIGVTSVALSADQIPYNFNDTAEIQRIKSNGSLLLHGFYFGVERSF